MPTYASFSRNRNNNAVSGIFVDNLLTLSTKPVKVTARITSKPGVEHTYTFEQIAGEPVVFTPDQLELVVVPVNEDTAKFKFTVDKDTRDQRFKEFAVSTLPTDTLNTITSGVSLLTVNDVPERRITNISFDPIYPIGVTEYNGYSSEYTMVFGVPSVDAEFFTHSELFKKTDEFVSVGKFYDAVNQYQPVVANQLVRLVAWFDLGGNVYTYDTTLRAPSKVSALLDSNRSMSMGCSELDFVQIVDLGLKRLRPNDIMSSISSGYAQLELSTYDVSISVPKYNEEFTGAACGCSELSITFS